MCFYGVFTLEFYERKCLLVCFYSQVKFYTEESVNLTDWPVLPMQMKVVYLQKLVLFIIDLCSWETRVIARENEIKTNIRKYSCQVQYKTYMQQQIFHLCVWANQARIKVLSSNGLSKFCKPAYFFFSLSWTSLVHIGMQVFSI